MLHMATTKDIHLVTYLQVAVKNTNHMERHKLGMGIKVIVNSLCNMDLISFTNRMLMLPILHQNNQFMLKGLSSPTHTQIVTFLTHKQFPTMDTNQTTTDKRNYTDQLPLTRHAVMYMPMKED